MSSALQSVRRFGGRLHRPWPWHRMVAETEHRCPACDGHGIIRNRVDSGSGWQTCPRCGFGDQA